ncbi:uncharacterized protein LOC144063740 isoform X3 [Vanacampus margaritifer]
MCATTKVKYEEELCGAQEENERRQLLSAECKQTRVVFNTADISDKYLRPQQQKLELPGVKGKEDLEPLQVKEEELPQSPNIKKEEQLPPCIKKEEEFTELPVTGVHLKTEDEGQYEENKGAESPRSSSSQPMATEIDDSSIGILEAMCEESMAVCEDSSLTDQAGPSLNSQLLSDALLTCPGKRKRDHHHLFFEYLHQFDEKRGRPQG